MSYKSRIFQPDQFSISSKDSVGRGVELEVRPGFYNSFRVNLPTPLLNVKSLQLNRVSIPNIVNSIPDEEIVFYYYRTPRTSVPPGQYEQMYQAGSHTLFIPPEVSQVEVYAWGAGGFSGTSPGFACEMVQGRLDVSGGTFLTLQVGQEGQSRTETGNGEATTIMRGTGRAPILPVTAVNLNQYPFFGDFSITNLIDPLSFSPWIPMVQPNGFSEYSTIFYFSKLEELFTIRITGPLAEAPTSMFNYILIDAEFGNIVSSSFISPSDLPIVNGYIIYEVNLSFPVPTSFVRIQMYNLSSNTAILHKVEFNPNNNYQILARAGGGEGRLFSNSPTIQSFTQNLISLNNEPTMILSPDGIQAPNIGSPYYQAGHGGSQQPGLLTIRYVVEDSGSVPTYDNLRVLALAPSYSANIVRKLQPNVEFNRIYKDYEDLTKALNRASAENTSLTPILTQRSIQNDIKFEYDKIYKKLIIKPTNQLFFDYWLPGFLDANVERLRNEIEIPLTKQRSLNMRCGFTQASGPTLVSSGVNGGTEANTYPQLVFSNGVAIYTDIIAGSSICSNGNPNLLATVPINVPALGVVNYASTKEELLSKVPREIYQLQITLKTDTNEPFYLPHSAITTVEFLVDYL